METRQTTARRRLAFPLGVSVGLTSFWLRPAGAQSYVVVLNVGSLRVTTGLVTIMRFLLYTRRPPPPLTLAVRWEQGESASRRPIRWSSSGSPPSLWSTAAQPQAAQAFLHSGDNVLHLTSICPCPCLGQMEMRKNCTSKNAAGIQSSSSYRRDTPPRLLSLPLGALPTSEETQHIRATTMISASKVRGRTHTRLQHPKLKTWLKNLMSAEPDSLQ